MSKSSFEIKAAVNELPRYNGHDKTAAWRKRVTNYLHGRCNDMLGLLRWAEKQQEEITLEVLTKAVHSDPAMSQVYHDPLGLSYHQWSWLNINLVEDAWNMFDGVDPELGFEV